VSRRIFEKRQKQVHEIPVREADSELSRHLLRVQEQERKRISRELHDETGQALMLLRLHLGMLAAEVPGRESQERIQQATELLDRTIGGLRRIIGRLSPRVLEELGLAAAIRKEARELGKNTGIKVHLSLPDNLGDLDPEVDVVAYRCVQEALLNIAKHSQARHVTMQIRNQGQSLILLIQDDGVGISNRGQARQRGFGLSGMRERVAALGGTVRISTKHASGTRLKIMLPAADVRTMQKHRPGTVELMKRAVISRAS
jgi:signal transduction histidine kinase